MYGNCDFFNVDLYIAFPDTVYMHDKKIIKLYESWILQLLIYNFLLSLQYSVKKKFKFKTKKRFKLPHSVEVILQYPSPHGQLQCDAISWEQLDNWHFSRGYNFWTNDLILILKTSACPFSYLAKVLFFAHNLSKPVVRKL